MTYNNSLRSLMAIAATAMLFTACKKAKTWEPLGDAGQTIVKAIGAEAPFGYRVINVDLVPEPQILTMLDVRRDVPNNAELNKPMTVVVQDDPGAVTTYDPTMLPLPANAYTIDASTPNVGGNYTLRFAPGEFAKEITFTLLDATLLDLNSKYGMGFTISTIDGTGKIAPAQKTVVVEIGIKNDYDGVYRLVFTNYHPTLNATYGPQSNTEVELRTTAANRVKLFWPDAGGYANPAILSGGFSYFGSQEPEYTINTTTNAVTVQNSFPAAATFYTMATGFNNRYFPSTRSMTVKWGYSYTTPGVFDASCREWTQEFTYLRPR
jgi:hypothetical protein